MSVLHISRVLCLTATLSDTKPEDDSDNEDDRILNAFTATINPIDRIVEDVVEEEELVESKFKKMDGQDDIYTAYEKLYKLSEKHESVLGMVSLPLILSMVSLLGFGYGFSSSNIASTRTTVFVPPSNNVEIENNNVKTDLASENLDKGKSILGAPLKQDKKEAKNPRAKKANSQKPK